MLCISAYEYVVGEAKMVKIVAIYFQASGFPTSRRNMLSRVAFISLGDMEQSTTIHTDQGCQR